MVTNQVLKQVFHLGYYNINIYLRGINRWNRYVKVHYPQCKAFNYLLSVLTQHSKCMLVPTHKIVIYYDVILITLLIVNLMVFYSQQMLPLCDLKQGTDQQTATCVKLSWQEKNTLVQIYQQKYVPSIDQDSSHKVMVGSDLVEGRRQLRQAIEYYKFLLKPKQWRFYATAIIKDLIVDYRFHCIYFSTHTLHHISGFSGLRLGRGLQNYIQDFNQWFFKFKNLTRS